MSIRWDKYIEKLFYLSARVIYISLRHVTLKEMLETEVADLLAGYPDGSKSYYWKNGEGEYHEITELDLFRGRFVTEDGDFSEFNWEIKESRIYVED